MIKCPAQIIGFEKSCISIPQHRSLRYKFLQIKSLDMYQEYMEINDLNVYGLIRFTRKCTLIVYAFQPFPNNVSLDIDI